MAPITISLFFLLVTVAVVYGMPNGNIEVTMPQHCQKNYCTTPSENYPFELIDDLLADLQNNIIINEDSIAKRVGEDERGDCENTKDMNPIYQIIDENDRVRYVVQSKKYKQIIEIEECAFPGRLTSGAMHFTDIQLQEFNMSCEETHVDYSFLVLSLNGTKLENVKAKGGIPVYCACLLKNM